MIHMAFNFYNQDSIKNLSATIKNMFLFICIVAIPVFPKSDSFIGIKNFSIDPAVSEYYKSIDLSLYQRLSFELLPRGIRPALMEDSSTIREFVAIVTGSIEIDNNEPVLNFTISSASNSEVETKKIPLENQSIDAIIDILAIKIRHFLEQTASGRLRVSSKPLDCDIFLNGIKIGKTPAELLLEQGTYSIQLQKEYLFPYRDTVTILPGSEIALSTTMKFMGHSLTPWMRGALIFSGGTIISRIVEIKLHQDYLKERDRSDFDKKYNRYKIANAISICFLFPTTITWAITGYNFLENISLKKRIFEAQ
jgi:hypothetical protein